MALRSELPAKDDPAELEDRERGRHHEQRQDRDGNQETASAHPWARLGESRASGNFAPLCPISGQSELDNCGYRNGSIIPVGSILAAIPCRGSDLGGEGNGPRVLAHSPSNGEWVFLFAEQREA